MAGFAITAGDVGGWIQVDITNLVAGWQTSPASEFGFALTHVDGTRVRFDTREAGNDRDNYIAGRQRTVCDHGHGEPVGDGDG